MSFLCEKIQTSS